MTGAKGFGSQSGSSVIFSSEPAIKHTSSMIKNLLSLAVMFLMSIPIVEAQTFEFRYHGESLADGTTVTIAAEEDEWGFGEMNCFTNPSSDPTNGLILIILSGSQNSGNATIKIEENSLYPSRILWCMGGNCMMVMNPSITKPFTADNGICLVQFDAEDIQSEGHLLATLTATIGSETHMVKIKFINGEQQDDNPVPGDVNGDGTVTAADITALYDFMLNNDSSHIVNGDQTGDNITTAADVTAVYSILLGD